MFLISDACGTSATVTIAIRSTQFENDIVAPLMISCVAAWRALFAATFQSRNARPSDVMAIVPVSLRPAGQPVVLRNEFTAMFVPLPSGQLGGGYAGRDSACARRLGISQVDICLGWI